MENLARRISQRIWEGVEKAIASHTFSTAVSSIWMWNVYWSFVHESSRHDNSSLREFFSVCLKGDMLTNSRVYQMWLKSFFFSFLKMYWWYMPLLCQHGAKLHNIRPLGHNYFDFGCRATFKQLTGDIICNNVMQKHQQQLPKGRTHILA